MLLTSSIKHSSLRLKSGLRSGASSAAACFDSIWSHIQGLRLGIIQLITPVIFNLFCNEGYFPFQ